MNTAPHKPEDGETGLQWLAFRYIAGEMTSSEAAAFEQQMQTDLAACEAVAAQVELTQTVVAASQLQESATPTGSAIPVTASRTTRMLPYVAAVTAAVAACLLAFVAGGWMVGNVQEGSPEVASPTGVEVVSPELAAQWSSARHDLKEALQQTLPALDEAVGEELVEGFGSIETSDEDAEAEVYGAPSWMLAAVAVQAPPSGEEELEN